MTAPGAWLAQRLDRCPECHALISRGRAHTYRDLQGAIRRWREVLAAHGLHPGTVVGLRSEHAPEAIALFLALLQNGNIAAPLPVAGSAPERYLELAHAHALFDFRSANDWRFDRLTPRQPPAILAGLSERQAAGLIVFTSGSTGEPKAALFDFAVLLRRYAAPARPYRTLVFLSLDHLGGIHTLLHTLAHGGTAVLAPDRHPEAVCRVLERHAVQLLPTTPTFLRMLVISGAHEGRDLSALEVVTYGTEPMPESTLRDLVRRFPHVRFKQTYGLSELGVLPTRSRAPGSLWLEVGGRGCEIRVEDGMLWIRSETAMLGYLNAPSPFDADGWYRTGDLVEVDGPYLRILGRSSEVINVGGEKVHPVEVEGVLLEVENVREATVWGARNAVTGQVVAARVSLERAEDRAALERRIHAFCRKRLAAYKVPVCVEIVDGGQGGPRFKKLRAGSPGADALR